MTNTVTTSDLTEEQLRDLVEYLKTLSKSRLRSSHGFRELPVDLTTLIKGLGS